MSYLTRAIGAVKLASKAHAPTILVVTGVVSMGAAVVGASKKTLHLEEALRPHVEQLEQIEIAAETAKNSPAVSYDDKLQARDRGKVYGRVAVDLTKLYFVPGVLFVGGAAMVFGGHRIMVQRNATLAVAFTTLSKAFDAYRANVREEFGVAADRGMLAGHKQIEVVDPETNETKVVNTLDWDNIDGDPYNRVFDGESSNQWIDDLGVNKLFLSNQQRMANIKLGLQGYLYLNEVYEALGFPPSDIGQVAGWKVKYLPDGSKDIPFVDFGIDTALPDDWKYSQKNAVYLDFNCQGLIVGGRVQKELEKR